MSKTGHRGPSRFDILFEPVKIGPVTAKNRFYQVPHCTGMGWLRPQMLAEMRGIKAEGGWGVVNTEYCSIHPVSDDLPYPYASLWDAQDIEAHRLMTDRVHQHGALAGVELWIGGARATNLFTREVTLDVDSRVNVQHPFQSRAMDRSDIRNVRKWHREAALRARSAEFDIVYVYATHGYLLSHFLSAETNTRNDEYGGSLENRVRLVRELIEETKEAVGDRCAVAVRFSADCGLRQNDPSRSESRDMIEMLAELPDLWDINIQDYTHEMGVSRFTREGSLESRMAYVKTITTKPVVSVGRFTSPDTMVSQVRRGVMDLIGAARPSIADPFLPNKIKEGRLEDIRECIGCNICYSGDGLGTPIHCTQNPTISEEWLRGWHPERIHKKRSDSQILVVGAGPAGLETARALGQRGYTVMLAEARRQTGGRVALECRLPGLGEWARVKDYREQQINRMSQVSVYLESELTCEDILELNPDHVVIATGAHWRRDGRGRHHPQPLAGLSASDQVYTPDELLAGRWPERGGRVMIFDDDHYYMAAVIADWFCQQRASVVLVTTASRVAAWGGYTTEQFQTQKKLIESGVEIYTEQALQRYDGTRATLSCMYTGREQVLKVDQVVMITSRQPNDGLYHQLRQRQDDRTVGKIFPLGKIGDCDAPSIIADAVYAGHRYARELDCLDGEHPVRYDRYGQTAVHKVDSGMIQS